MKRRTALVLIASLSLLAARRPSARRRRARSPNSRGSTPARGEELQQAGEVIGG